MDAVTYPQEKVANFIREHLIPLRIDVNDDSFYRELHTFWTPTLAVMDNVGHEVQRTIGFYRPDDLIASLHLGIAKAHLSCSEHDTAEVHFSRLIEEFSTQDIVPEAMFFRGVNEYKWKNDPTALKRAYERLCAEFPDSPWTRRAEPYRLI